MERRAYETSELRVDSAEGKPTRLTGYAAVFNQNSVQLDDGTGPFTERIEPGAFAGGLGGDIRALYNHNTDLVLGRTRAGTLRLAEDHRGLAFDLDVPDTQAGRDLTISVARGDLSGMSFGFSVPKGGDAWAKVGNDWTRSLRSVRLIEVSPCTFPAYLGTEAIMRSANVADAKAGLKAAQEEEARTQATIRAEAESRDRWLRMMERGHFEGAELRKATPYGDLPIFDQRDHAWDAAAADGRVRKWASSDDSGDKDKMSWPKYRRAFFWYDSANAEGFAGYKLGFADVDAGTLKAVPRGIFAVAAVLQGGRGGVDIPEAEQTSIKANVARYYKKLAKQFNDKTIVAPWEEKAAPDEAELRARALSRIMARRTIEQREQSFEDKMNAIYAGLLGLLGSPWSSDGSWWGIEATFDDRVIVETFEGAKKLYLYPMTFDAAGVPKFGEPQQVEVQYVAA